MKYTFAKRKKRRNKTKRKYIKKKVRYIKGGNNNNTVSCVMCGNNFQANECLMPGQCYRKHGSRLAHRICKECWFDKFAIEGVDHECPGCKNNLPLNNVTTTKPNPDNIINIID